FIDVLKDAGDLVIYDRNFGKDDPLYMFPDKYKRWIAGHLPFEKIDIAYKGYRYGVNMNSVKYSQSMFARRAPELMACNTIVVSNYSRALRLLFGDLPISTDDPGELAARLKVLDDDEVLSRKIRLAALRKAVGEHSYRDRLARIAGIVRGRAYEDDLPEILVLGATGNKTDRAKIQAQFDRQTYPHKTLAFDAKKVDGFVAVFVPQDDYGPNYLTDLALALRYAPDAVAIGKADVEYRTVDRLPVRAALIRDFPADLFAHAATAELTDGPLLAIDRFNYGREERAQSDALPDLNTGLDAADLFAAADGLSPSRRERIICFCRSPSGARLYEPLIRVIIRIPHRLWRRVDKVNNLLFGLTGLRKWLGPSRIADYRAREKDLRSDTGKADQFNPRVPPTLILGKSDILIVTNKYPEYGNPYQNGFLHRRVLRYRAEGLHSDVIRCNCFEMFGSYEYDGVDVTTGFRHELQMMLESGRYRTVGMHFLNPAIWSILKKYLDKVRIIVWIHGAEVQPWHRRSFNFSSQREKIVAMQRSRQRMSFWRSVMKQPHSNLHFVFVSDYLAEQVMTDVGICLPRDRYDIIHNYIDTDLFEYREKTAEHRKKILSIRPYASRVYANDLMVAAILDLKDEPFFGEFEFRLIGDGALFDETLAPIRDLPNVRIEQRFLQQGEIAAFHGDYGVFLSPSRMDTQGVSRDEAMASGLVPITSRVAAVPEFVDESCGILAEHENAKELADGIRRLYHDPDLFLEMSKNAAVRVRAQSGCEQTIHAEIKLIEGVIPELVPEIRTVCQDRPVDG
ncbi:MAG: glycosyltransferase, partial [Pseudomonadota bacterium]|nr:glycosyltransferase [Pseudomonadota bacterium]